ncbi:hypothetical protein E2R51_08335 [Jeotgalibacillus sp. S-D1]|uniref:hypothetical protein n=1 Tax=Jeotgalibacillus sp. S-D1 TaxID=2552189 RepID=UPI00105A6203|nr:hypothetical protein [Jeotgalibacillus sp. S-D1]TDL32679.1 hypothetical protein E2R51_08335 [Jeotgalibacillus sp. S-D1]
MFMNSLFKRMPHSEQSMCEKKLTIVMKQLKIDYFNFNWDRNSCYIEFNYHDSSYKLMHSIEKARKRGVVLRNGLECLIELTSSLEDLCVIIDRGTYNFETWIAGMKQSTPLQESAPSQEATFQEATAFQEAAASQEEIQIAEKPVEEKNSTEFNRHEQLIPFASSSTIREFDRKQITQRKGR